MIDIKNIIIIGKIGSGKSALANVLSGTEVFKEISSSAIEIWRTKDKEFEVKEKGGEEEKKLTTKYRVIDTVGLGGKILDEKNKKELLEKFEEEIGSYIDEGVSQIFLLISGKERLDEKILDEFLWLNERLFDNEALSYTTIVRNNFNEFRDKSKCKEDTEMITAFFKNKEIYQEISAKIVSKEKVVYVDNSPLDIDDEEELELNRENRNESRKNLLNCLDKFKEEVSYRTKTSNWLDKNYHPLESERKAIIILDVSKQNLKGRLSLKGFTNLKRLNCADNQLTNLDLSDCLDLVELKCNNNQFTNLNFAKSVSNLEKLEIQGNKNLHSQSLKVLVDLPKLVEVNINDTSNISRGWECLLKNCQKLYCNSPAITERLDQKNCLVQDEEKKYYNLDKWRKINKQNELTVSVIPLERLFIIRSNLKKFVDKWGVKENSNEDKKNSRLKNCITWPYDKINKLWKKDENLSELSKLECPEDFSKQWWLITGIQWTNRAASVAGGSLLLVGTSRNDDRYTEAGGVIAIIAPFVETVTSYANDKIYEVKQKKWDEFIEDTKNMLDSYHELLGILEKIEEKKLGKVNKALNDLRVKTKDFLNKYDKEKNGERNFVVDVDELTDQEPRKELIKDLNNENENKEEGGSQLGDIVKAMRELEKAIADYKQGKAGEEKKGNQLAEEIKNKKVVDEPENGQEQLVHTTVEIKNDDLDKYLGITKKYEDEQQQAETSRSTTQLIASQEIPPKGLNK